MAAEPRVIVCLHDLTLWYLDRTNRFPKNRRITLGDKIDNLLLDMLTIAHLASMRKEKKNLLTSLSEKLEVLRIFTRLCRELKCLELRQYEFAARQMEEIGKQLGGWLKFCKG